MGTDLYRVDCADCLTWLASLPERSVDLVFGSPPYEAARLYLEGGKDMGIARDTEEWVAWMVEVVRASLRVCKGLVAFVVGHGQTKNYRWSGAPALLCADLIRAGITLRDPKIYRRVGIPGSGGPDDLRRDFEFIVCATNGGRLPWSDNTALGHKPKWAPGGEMSHRLANGQRVNSRERMVAGKYRPCHRMIGGPGANGKIEQQSYVAPEIANPGNIVHCVVGGGRIGDRLAHETEAPFPEKLAEFFVRSFCPENGICCDPFSGSGTTAAVALRWGRRALCCDLRQSQVGLTRRRVAGEIGLFHQKPGDA